MSADPAIAAAWYPDPHGAADLRWWDGNAWTEHTAATPVQPAADASPHVASAATPAAASMPTATEPFAYPVTMGEAPSATKAMVAGILALVFNVALVPSILAIRWAGAARTEIAQSGGTMGGAGKATFARIAGWLGIAFAIVGIAMVVLGVTAGVKSVAGDVDYARDVAAVIAVASEATAPAPGDGTATPAQLVADLQSDAASMRDAAAKLQALSPPDRLAADHARLVAAVEQGATAVESVVAAASAKDQAAMARAMLEVTAAQTELQAAATAIDAKL